MASKLIEGTYPNYRQVIPAQCEERVTVERESLLTALRRVSLLTTDKSNATKLTFGKNKLIDHHEHAGCRRGARDDSDQVQRARRSPSPSIPSS